MTSMVDENKHFSDHSGCKRAMMFFRSEANWQGIRPSAPFFARVKSVVNFKQRIASFAWRASSSAFAQRTRPSCIQHCLGALVGTRLREGGHCACASFASSATEITRSSCGRVELTVSTCVAVQHWWSLVDRCAGACLQAKAGLEDSRWRHCFFLQFVFFLVGFCISDFGGSVRRFP